jgi:hypothetical protein
MRKFMFPLVAVAFAGMATAASAQTATNAPMLSDPQCGPAISMVREHITGAGARLDDTSRTRAEDMLAEAGAATNSATCMEMVQNAAGLVGFTVPMAGGAMTTGTTAAPAAATAGASVSVAGMDCEAAISRVRDYITAEGAQMDATSRTRAETSLARASGADSPEACFRAVERAAGFAGFEADLM